MFSTVRLCDPMDYLVHVSLQTRILEWVAFPFSKGSSQPRSNPGLLHCGQILYLLSHKGSPSILEWVASCFSSGSSRPRNRTRVSFIAGWFFTNWAIREAQGKSESRSGVWFSAPSWTVVHGILQARILGSNPGLPHCRPILPW